MKCVLVLALAACDEPLDQRLALIDEPRVLAVIAEPAEAKPKAMVTYSIVTASPDGPLTIDPAWSYCTAPKPPTEDNAVPVPCVSGEQLIALGAGPTITGTLPADGCLLYGPDTPPGGFRPRDADSTGGYYQPVRADVGDLLAFGLSRITCNLPTVPADLSQRYNLEYVANENPTLDPLDSINLGTVPADTDIELAASWPIEAAESYLFFDTFDQQLIDRRESMRVSWFATGGTLAVDSTLVGEDDAATVTTASTTWHTPAAGTAHVWIVLRDSRGGIATRQLAVTVECRSQHLALFERIFEHQLGALVTVAQRRGEAGEDRIALAEDVVQQARELAPRDPPQHSLFAADDQIAIELGE